MNPRNLALLSGIIAIGSFLIAPHVSAQAISLVPDCARFQTTTPGLDCVLEAFLGFARFILSITGSVALLIFVWAGAKFLINAYKPDEAKKALEILRNAVIGLAIILCSGIGVNYLQTTLRGQQNSNQPCVALANGYACMENSQGVNCKTGLCLGDAKASVQCCQPAREPFVSERCKNEKGNEYSCVDIKDGTDCAAGFCPGGKNIQCCITSQGAGAAPAGAAPKKIGCMDAGSNTFLGCQELDSCTATGGLCTDAGVREGDCIQDPGDIRCGENAPNTKLIYGCFDLADSSPRPLLGCVEVPNRSACNSACEAGNRSLSTCGFDVESSPADQECFNQ